MRGSSRASMSDDTSISPLAAARIAAVTSAAGLCLVTKPLAPASMAATSTSSSAFDVSSSMHPADVERRDVRELDAHRQLVGELAEQLSHDLANRLAVARLTAEVLANRPDLPDDLAARVATVVHATSEAGDLVQQLSA